MLFAVKVNSVCFQKGGLIRSLPSKLVMKVCNQDVVSLVDFSALAGFIEVLDPIQGGLAADELGNELGLPVFV